MFLPKLDYYRIFERGLAYSRGPTGLRISFKRVKLPEGCFILVVFRLVIIDGILIDSEIVSFLRLYGFAASGTRCSYRFFSFVFSTQYRPTCIVTRYVLFARAVSAQLYRAARRRRRRRLCTLHARIWRRRDGAECAWRATFTYTSCTPC